MNRTTTRHARGSKTSVLFLCTNNSARSQMAEGLLKTIYRDRYDAFSAGIHPIMVHPLAIKVMSELGIDISNQRSKNVLEFEDIIFDIVVTLCDPSRGSCPIAQGKTIVHTPFMDPASVKGSDDHRVQAFREVRDDISHWVREELVFI